MFVVFRCPPVRLSIRVRVRVRVRQADQKLDLPLRLPGHHQLNRAIGGIGGAAAAAGGIGAIGGADGGCDQGYGSERSPEDEVPPVLPHHPLAPPHHPQLPYEAVLARQPPAMVTFAADAAPAAAADANDPDNNDGGGCGGGAHGARPTPAPVNLFGFVTPGTQAQPFILHDCGGLGMGAS